MKYTYQVRDIDLNIVFQSLNEQKAKSYIEKSPFDDWHLIKVPLDKELFDPDSGLYYD